ncbi:hypothetical protein Rsub_00641 [Raphidocelis subcapitata]|uniref:Phytase-like domain-containing protein n=1 Tax=Raphidocelis subcapitata TaxID=307507 RepID=A0A2V0NLG4_9CHLO|nr:hypothetical protein Rsub_00641 [Raphidocelis subcapitata]|eukprot:GBF87929.1 hypothetical protein Rsub_00641 [Raphidocelis subcapitata]
MSPRSVWRAQPRASRAALLVALVISSACGAAARSSPINCANSTYTWSEIENGFGDRVSFNRNGGILGVHSQGNTTNRSGAYVLQYGGKDCEYKTPPIKLEPPAGVNASAVEFGSSITVDATGKTVLVITDEQRLPVAASNMVNLGFVYAADGAPTSKTLNYSLSATISVEIIVDPLAFGDGNWTELEINDATGAISDNGKIIVIAYMLALYRPNETDPTPGEMIAKDLPGAAIVLEAKKAGGPYEQIALLSAPDPLVEKGTFGRDLALSGDGKTIALSEDNATSVYIYKRSTKDPAVFPLYQVLTDVIPVGGQVEDLALDKTGKVLAQFYALPDPEPAPAAVPDPENPDTGAIIMWVLKPGTPASNKTFVKSCQTENLPVDADGLDMAFIAGYQRVGVGFASYGMQIWDYKLSDLKKDPPVCPGKPATEIKPQQIFPEIQDFAEAISLSSDGKTAVLGFEVENMLVFQSLKPPAYYIREQQA